MTVIHCHLYGKKNILISRDNKRKKNDTEMHDFPLLESIQDTVPPFVKQTPDHSLFLTKSCTYKQHQSLWKL